MSPTRAAASLLLIVLAAVTTPDPARAAGPVFPELAPDAPVGSGTIRPCLDELEGTVRCGRLRVFEDRAAATGRTLDLAFVVADALEPPPEVASAVAWFFGGPGVSVIETAGTLIPGARGLRRERDLLLLDFRGVAFSGALDCDVPWPGGVAGRFGSLFSPGHLRACRQRLEERARLDLYTSDHNIDDLEDLRRWLNYGALDLVGGSYGTREIQVYLRRHPGSVRTVVLNGVAPISSLVYVTHARGLQRALDELVAECARDPECARDHPDLGATVRAVLEQVRSAPPTVEAEGEPVSFEPADLGYALRGLLYRRSEELPALLEGAARGEWQPLADYYLERTAWVGAPGGFTGMHLSVICAEDIDRLDDATVARETAGTFLGDHLIESYRRACAEWPHAKLDPGHWEPVRADVPALLLSGSLDPVTPPAGGDELARHLPNSLHLVVQGGGHGVRGPCIGDIQTRFVEAGTVDGLDTSCLGESDGAAADR